MGMLPTAYRGATMPKSIEMKRCNLCNEEMITFIEYKINKAKFIGNPNSPIARDKEFQFNLCSTCSMSFDNLIETYRGKLEFNIAMKIAAIKRMFKNKNMKISIRERLIKCPLCSSKPTLIRNEDGEMHYSCSNSKCKNRKHNVESLNKNKAISEWNKLARRA